MNGKSIRFTRLSLFLLLSIGLSNIFRFDIWGVKEAIATFPTWLFILSAVLLEGSGVFIGAMVGLYLLRKERKTQMSFYGSSRKWSILMASIPVVLVAVIGIKNEYQMDAHVYGIIAVAGSLLYCMLEEYGWRGYLQEELSGLKPGLRYVVIGFIWYFWHLSFLTDAGLKDNLFFLGMLIFGSWGIGQVAEATRSIVASACFHLIIQMMMFNALVKNGLDGTQKMIILGVSVALWVLILRVWQKRGMKGDITD